MSIETSEVVETPIVENVVENIVPKEVIIPEGKLTEYEELAKSIRKEDATPTTTEATTEATSDSDKQPENTRETKLTEPQIEGLVKNENGDYEYELGEDSLLQGVNDYFKEDGISFQSFEDIKNLIAESNQIKDTFSKLKDISPEDLNTALAIKKVGVDKFVQLNSIKQDLSPETILRHKYKLDNLGVDEDLLEEDFQRDVMSKYQNYSSEELSQKALARDAKLAYEVIEGMKSELKSLVPEIKQEAPQNNVQIEQYNKEYLSKVDNALSVLKETVPFSVKNEKGEEIAKVNVPLSKEELATIQKALDANAPMFYDTVNKNKGWDNVSLDALRDRYVDMILTQKAISEAYKLGRSDQEKSSFQAKINANADIPSGKFRADEPKINSLNDKEAWIKQRLGN